MTIANWTEAELRRFIVNVLNDPAALPKSSNVIALDKLAHLVLKGPNDYQQYQVKFGTLSAVTADGGGWLNYSIDAFPVAIDAVLAMNRFGGTSGNTFQDIQIQSSGTFRCFIGTAGVTADCMYIAIGH